MLNKCDQIGLSWKPLVIISLTQEAKIWGYFLGTFEKYFFLSKYWCNCFLGKYVKNGLFLVLQTGHTWYHLQISDVVSANAKQNVPYSLNYCTFVWVEQLGKIWLNFATLASL